MMLGLVMLVMLGLVMLGMLGLIMLGLGRLDLSRRDCKIYGLDLICRISTQGQSDSEGKYQQEILHHFVYERLKLFIDSLSIKKNPLVFIFFE